MHSWTDFLKARLDPACVRLLPELWQGASDFDGFGAGAGVLAREEAREEALDALRVAAEECDRLQVRACAGHLACMLLAHKLYSSGSRRSATGCRCARVRGTLTLECVRCWYTKSVVPSRTTARSARRCPAATME